MTATVGTSENLSRPLRSPYFASSRTARPFRGKAKKVSRSVLAPCVSLRSHVPAPPPRSCARSPAQPAGGLGFASHRRFDTFAHPAPPRALKNKRSISPSGRFHKPLAACASSPPHHLALLPETGRPLTKAQPQAPQGSG